MSTCVYCCIIDTSLHLSTAVICVCFELAVLLCRCINYSVGHQERSINNLDWQPVG